MLCACTIHFGAHTFIINDEFDQQYQIVLFVILCSTVVLLCHDGCIK